ncbi:MAG: PAS domain-containing sensor histidine kinase [Vicingaceae bacterium]
MGKLDALKKLKEVELKLEAISNQSSDGITIADVDGNYVFVNPAFCEMSGYSEEELLKLTVFDMKAPNQDHSSFQKTKESPQIITVVLKKKDGTPYYSEIVGDVIYLNDEKFVLGTVRDVSERVESDRKIRELNENLEKLVEERTKELNITVKKLNNEINQRALAEKKIKESLNLKEVLLKEITHRVKNNFQIITSLINLQKRTIKNNDIVDVLDQTANRIQSMALIHETLHKSNTFDDVAFKEYVESLTEYIKTISNNSDVDIELDICDSILPVADATNYGMIIMELVTNSLKYAFPNQGKGKILLRMKNNGNGSYSLTVSDDGVGMPKSIDYKNTESLGMQVVMSLTEQLGGKIELLESEDSGTVFEITV